MSKFHKTIIFVLFVIMAFAALLSPAPRLLSDVAKVAPTVASEEVAWTLPSLILPDDGFMPFGYTWAG